jgi:hypothetical protein
MRTVLDRVLITTSGLELHDSLDMKIQGFHHLPNDVLGHPFTQVLYQKPHTAVLRDRECVEIYTYLPNKDPQCTDHGSEPVGC